MSSNDSNQGLRTLFHPDPGGRPEVDIVFVHGLRGHRLDTWSKGSCCWIETLVPKDLPRARVMTFGYDSSVAQPREPISQSSIFGPAENLLDALKNERRVNDASKRPIIFVGHSLGGLVIKQALIRSKQYFQNGQDARLGAIGQQALGAVFMATPHRGSDAARLADVICKAAKATWIGPNPHILDTLKSDSDVLESQRNSFVSISQSMLLVSIYEELKTRGQMIVPQWSAVMGVFNERSNSVHANHIEVCKFDNQKDDGYKKVIGYIRSMIDDARSSPEALDPDDQCLQSLCFDGMKWRSDITQKTAGTCDWVLHHAEYVRWDHDGGLLWIQGSPGTGKSTIMASLLDHVAEDSYSASFFFNRQGTGLQYSPIGFFRAILHQILSQDAEILSKFRQETHFDERREKESNDRVGLQWTASELQDCLTRCIKRFTKRRQLCLYIDGLDESGLAAAQDLAIYLEGLRVEVPTGLRICLSCRTWPGITWKSDYCIRVKDNNEQDIELFILDSFKHSLRLRDPDTLHDILKQISSRAEGRFQWTVLVVKRVLRLQNASKDDILRDINSTPYEVSESYDLDATAHRDDMWEGDVGGTSANTFDFASETKSELQKQFDFGHESATTTSMPAFNLNDTEPALTMADTLPTSVTISTDHRPDAWDDNSVGSILDDFGLGRDIEEQLQRKFADHILGALELDQAELTALQSSVTDQFSKLLKDFAIFCRKRARSHSEVAATRFLRKYRKNIDKFFKMGLSQTVLAESSSTSSDDDRERPEPFHRDFYATVGDWNRNVTLIDQDNLTEIPTNDKDDSEGDDLDDSSSPKLFAEFEALLHDSAEHTWLLSQIKTIGRFDNGHGTMLNIRRSLLEAVDRRKTTSPEAEPVFKITVPWRPFHFLKSQFPHNTELPPLESVIVICGSPAKPYATTCGEYVRFVWPAYGHEAMRMAQARINERTASEHPDALEELSTTFEVSGSYLRSIEIAETLIWFAVACRASESSSTIMSCKPKLVHDNGAALEFRLEYEMKDVAANDTSDCWHGMFRNPAIALGYPVPLRSHEELGLEVSTFMLSALSRATWATVFAGIVVLKGWCTMAMMVAKMGESVVWHFAASHDGDRIPYPRERPKETFDISEAFFPGARHFIAWTRSAKSLIGTSEAVYHKIWWSKDTESVNAGACFEPSATISGGKYVTAGVRISFGKKDTPVNLSAGNYEDCVDKASRWNVIFSDTKTRMHWLSDGASAILHFCKAYLTPDLMRQGSNATLALTQPFDDRDAFGPDWAYQTLTDPGLRRIPLRGMTVFESKGKTTLKDAGPQQPASEERSTEYTATQSIFEGVAMKYFRYLEQAYDRSVNIRLSKDLYIETPWPKSEIVGFEFRSILQSDGFVEPKKFAVSTPARAWLKLAKEIDSINILGSDFGDLIEPSAKVTTEDSPPCTRAPPKGCDYLVAPLSVLRTIAKPRTGHTWTSVQLTDGLHWHNVNGGLCICSSCLLSPSPSPCRASVVKLHDKAASLTKKEPSIEREHPIFDQHHKGAIIFGEENCGVHESRSASASSQPQLLASSGSSASSPSTPSTSKSSGSRRPGSVKSKIPKFSSLRKTDDTK